MAYLFKGAYATMSERQKMPKLLDKPFYEPLSLDEILDIEIKGWQKMSAKKLLVCFMDMHAVVMQQREEFQFCR